jgi:tetratricopeptide (TPR) repeat protein
LQLLDDHGATCESNEHVHDSSHQNSFTRGTIQQQQGQQTSKPCRLLEDCTAGTWDDSSTDSSDQDSVILQSSKPASEYEEGMDPFSVPLRVPLGETSLRGSLLLLLGTILFNLARLVHHKDQNHKVALHHYQRARRVLHSLPNGVNLAILTSLGYLYYSQGGGVGGRGDPHGEALELYTAASEMSISICGPDSLEAAACWNCLGVLYYAMCSSSSGGHLDDSMKALQESLRIRRNLLGDDHPDTATTWNNLGRLYYVHDKYDDALTAYRQALRIRRKSGVSDTVDVAATIFNIGQVYHQMQDYDDALVHYRDFMKLARMQFGAYHRDICIVTSCIGQLLHSTKAYSGALKTYHCALSIGRQVFGDVNAEVAIIYNKMGNLYYDIGDLDAALQAYHKGLKVEMQLLGDDDDVNIHVTYSNIVEIHKQRSEFDRALHYCQELLKLQKKRQPSVQTAEEIASTLSAIARIHHHKGEYDIALEVNQECLGLWREIKGDHMDERIASALFHTAMDLVKLGRSQMALDAMLEAYRIRKSFGDDTVELASVTYNVALIHHRHGSHELALRYYRETARIEKKILGTSHRDLSVTLYNLGQIYYQRGDLELSLQHFRQALSIERECFGNDHPTCARTLMEIGNIEVQQGNMTGLMEAFSEALRIYRDGTIDQERFVVYGIELWHFDSIQPQAAAVA